jgi:hypothetical protein
LGCVQKLHDLTLNVQGLANKADCITGVGTPNPLGKFIRAYQDQESVPAFSLTKVPAFS